MMRENQGNVLRVIHETGCDLKIAKEALEIVTVGLIPTNMPEKECEPITEEFIEQFLLEAQSHSGLPAINDVSLYYVSALSAMLVPDDLLDRVMAEFINTYMKVTHELYMRNKTWKSYDW